MVLEGFEDGSDEAEEKAVLTQAIAVWKTSSARGRGRAAGLGGAGWDQELRKTRTAHLGWLVGATCNLLAFC